MTVYKLVIFASREPNYFQLSFNQGRKAVKVVGNDDATKMTKGKKKQRKRAQGGGTGRG